MLHDELHWLDVHERTEYKLGVMVYQCLHDWAPQYLADHLIPASDVMIFWHSNDDMKFYVRKYDQRICV